MNPYVTLLLAAAIGLLAGLLGGVGGRQWRWGAAVDDLWDAIETLSTRLSKREGKAGRQIREERAGTPDPRALAGLFQLLKGRGGAPVDDQVEMERRAAEHFRKKDRGDAA